MMGGSCPQEMENVSKDMEESRSSVQNRMAEGPAGCQCVPDFLLSLVMGGKERPAARAAVSF